MLESEEWSDAVVLFYKGYGEVRKSRDFTDSDAPPLQTFSEVPSTRHTPGCVIIGSEYVATSRVNKFLPIFSLSSWQVIRTCRAIRQQTQLCEIIKNHGVADVPASSSCLFASAARTTKKPGRISVWNAANSDTPVTQFAPVARAYALDCHPSTGRLWSGSVTGSLESWNLEKCEREFFNGEAIRPGCYCGHIAFDEERGLVLGVGNRRLCAFAPRQGREPVACFHGLEHQLCDVIYSPQCQLLVNYDCAGGQGVKAFDVRNLFGGCVSQACVNMSRGSSGCHYKRLHQVADFEFLHLNGRKFVTIFKSNGSRLSLYAARKMFPENVHAADSVCRKHALTFVYKRPTVFPEDERQRLEYVIENIESFSPLRVRYGDDCLLRIPKLFFYESSICQFLGDATEFQIDGGFRPIDEANLLKLFFGCCCFDEEATAEGDQLLFDLFHLFRSLGMKKRAYLVCDHLRNVKDPAMLIFFLGELSIPLYERCEEDEGEGETEEIEIDDSSTEELLLPPPPPVGDDSPLPPPKTTRIMNWSCGLTLALLNELKSREKEIEESEDLTQKCEALSILSRIRNHAPSPLHQHPDFQFEEEAIPKSWMSLSAELLTRLHGDVTFADVTLVSTRETEHLAHLPILIWKTNFIHNLMHSGFAEAQQVRESGRLVIRDLSPEVITALLEFVYLGHIEMDPTTENLPMILMDLYAHAHKYVETELKKCVLAKIKLVTSALLMKIASSGQSTSFENQFLLPVAYRLREPEVFDDLREFWSLAISPETLRSVIDRSVLEMRVQERMDGMEARLDCVVDQMHSLEGKLDELLCLVRKSEE